MTDRERLIDLIKKAEKQELLDFFTADLDEAIDMSGGTQFNGTVEHLADYLLKHGVIVLPCKVGDTVYFINRANKPQEMIFDLIDLRCTCVNDTDCMCGSLCNDIGHNVCQYRFKNDFSDFGKTVFLSREEAERALSVKGA